jgi:hypothetical protein
MTNCSVFIRRITDTASLATGGRAALVTKTVVGLGIWAHLWLVPGCPLAACWRHAGASCVECDAPTLQRCGNDSLDDSMMHWMRRVWRPFCPSIRAVACTWSVRFPYWIPRPRPSTRCSRVGGISNCAATWIMTRPPGRVRFVERFVRAHQ